MSEIFQTLTVIAPPSEPPIDVATVRDDHLKAANGTAEDSNIERLIRVTWRYGEKITRRCWMPTTFELTLDEFPCEALWLPRPPTIEVVSIDYIAADGTPTTLAPADYKVSLSGRENKRTRITPAFGKVWPVTRSEADAVTVTYRAGYIDPTTSPETVDIEPDLVHGMLLMIGELYKQRSESVHAFNQNPAVIRAKDLWMQHRIY